MRDLKMCCPPAVTRLIARVLVASVVGILGVADAADGNPQRPADVVIYGATPGGIAAAVAVARRDAEASVVLVTRYRRIGGMITSGLTHPDFRTFEARTGLFREFNRRVEAHYRRVYGADSHQVRNSLSGTHAGPEVNHTVLSQMIAELPGITVLTQHRLGSVQCDGRKITAVVLRSADGETTLWAAYFVDATYEGDLAAAAGVPFRVGREGRGEFGESLTPPQFET